MLLLLLLVFLLFQLLFFLLELVLKNNSVSVFICCNSDLYMLMILIDLKMIMINFFICNPLPTPTELSIIPPFVFNLIFKVGLI